MPKPIQTISVAARTAARAVAAGGKGVGLTSIPAFLLLFGLAVPIALVGSRPASADCGMSEVRSAGNSGRHTYNWVNICDGHRVIVETAYDLASARASEQITGDGWSIKSYRTCTEDPWIYVGSPPQCGGAKVEIIGRELCFALFGRCEETYTKGLPSSAEFLSRAERHILFAQLQNALAMTPPTEVPPPPDPLADEVQDSAQDDGAVVVATVPGIDLAVASMDGPNALQSGLSGTFVVAVKNAGNAAVPLELHIVFGGKLDQTGQIIAGAGLACEVVHDAGINAAVRCTGGQLPRGETTTVTVQGRGQSTAGAGMLIATLNASRSVAETTYDNNLEQFNVAINAGPAPTTPAPPAPPAPPMPQSPPMQVGMCGPPGGMAVVVIPNPNLHTLNVRASPGGTVLTAIEEGSQVSIVGECGPEAAAGFTKPPAGKPSGWCQIDAPVTGCVSAKFLAFGVPGEPAAGLAKAPTKSPPVPAKVAMEFSGEWAASAENVAYTITLQQTGKSVTGDYNGADGSVGKIAGKVSGKVLRFSWIQTDGNRGSGKFALADDGLSFAGSYTFGENPDQADGGWSGIRQ
jgi:hypothetical protein